MFRAPRALEPTEVYLEDATGLLRAIQACTELCPDRKTVEAVSTNMEMCNQRINELDLHGEVHTINVRLCEE